MSRKTILFIIISIVLGTMLIGCEGMVGDVNSDDPIIKGCSYIAGAIVTAAVIRAIFND